MLNEDAEDEFRTQNAEFRMKKEHFLILRSAFCVLRSEFISSQPARHSTFNI